MFEGRSSGFERYAEKEASHEKLALPELEKLPPEIQEVARELKELTGSWNPVELYTPDTKRMAEEQKKVREAYLKGEEYNPEYTYVRAGQLEHAEARTKLKEMQKKVRGVKAESRVDRLARVAFDRKIKDDLATTYLIEGINQKNDALVAKGCGLKYEKTDNELIALADELYRNACKKEQPKREKQKGLLSDSEIDWIKTTDFDAQEIATAFRTILKEYGIYKETEAEKGFKVLVDSRASCIDVRDKSTEGSAVFIPPERVLKGDILLQYLDHEIGSHAVQSMNGEQLFGIGGGQLRFDDESLYEGLAMGREARYKKEMLGIENDVDPSWWIYVKAAQSAEEGKSFAQVYKEQVDLQLHWKLKIDPDEPVPTVQELQNDPDPEKKLIAERSLTNAFNNTHRIMRGHTDMSNKEGFGMVKDIGYLRGYLLQKKLNEANLGFKNESAIISKGGLLMVAEFQLEEGDLPIKYELVGPDNKLMTPSQFYWETVLKPRFQKEAAEHPGLGVA